MDVVGGWHSFSDGHVTCKSLNYASSLSQNPITVRQLCVQNASCEFDGDSQSISQSINQSSPCYQHKILPTYIHTYLTYLPTHLHNIPHAAEVPCSVPMPTTTPGRAQIPPYRHTSQPYLLYQTAEFVIPPARRVKLGFAARSPCISAPPHHEQASSRPPIPFHSFNSADEGTCEI